MTRTAQGLGLGLFAASRLAAVLDGTIRFETRPGGGTVAIVERGRPGRLPPVGRSTPPAPRPPEASGRLSTAWVD